MRVARWIVACLVVLAVLPAAAQSLEGVLMPGKVIAGHAKVEDDCARCHVRFDRAAQDALCRDCHKDVGADVAAKRGLHGRQAPKPCRACHTDHKGRDVDIAPLDEKAFEHVQTDFALRGAHAKLACKSCHMPGKKRRAAPQACVDCHGADDRHRGALGPACADCHSETTWKDARFDHARTKFALAGAHEQRKCADCHRDLTFRSAPTTCAGCHRDDDRQHRGRLGDRCDACHGVRDWKTTTFHHDRDTRYALKGRHRTAKCESCHTAPPAREKLPGACVDCHRKDDRHEGTLGRVCGDCHVESGWRETRIDHDRTRFALVGRHRDVPCRDCHRDPKAYRPLALDCASCHGRDDPHKTRYGARCELCHDAFDWTRVAFRHDRDTRYALRGRHAAVRCDACHAGRLYEDKLAADCHACHRKDDRHKGELGDRCAGCHDETGWKVARFDHARTRFALAGAHARLECRSCHRTALYRDAPRDCHGCHRPDDRHEGTLGRECAQCHNVRDWRTWDFDHRRTRFALDGGHAGLACRKCHVMPGQGVAPLPVDCASCHRGDDVHRGEYGADCARCHVAKTWREIKGLGRAAPAAPAGTARGQQ
jgi:hypothetical protein